MLISARAVTLVAVYLFVAATAGSVLAWLLAGVLDYPYLKVLSRGILLFAALGLIPLWRSAGLSAAAIGLNPVRARDAVAAYPLGFAMVLPLMLFFLVVQFRVFDDRVDYGDWTIWRFALLALGSSLLVGLFEETLFRGVLFTALRGSASFAVSATMVGFLYAAVHYLAGDGEDVAIVDVAWYTGYLYVVDSFGNLASPAAYWDSFVALFLLGVLFCWVRERVGLWWCIGLHACWVFAIRIFKEITVRDVFSPYQVLVSSYDNFVGHLVSIWLLFVFVVLALYRRVKSG